MSKFFVTGANGFIGSRLIEALEILSTKRETLPAKKHGNIPV